MHMAYWVAFAIAYPCRIRDSLRMFAPQVNVYALNTLEPWSFRRLSQTPSQKEAERGHPGSQFVNLLLVPRMCPLLVSSLAKEGSFWSTFRKPICSGWP